MHFYFFDCSCSILIFSVDSVFIIKENDTFVCVAPVVQQQAYLIPTT